MILLSISWATGLVYLAVRAQLPAPVPLAVVDAVHIYVGLASLALVAAIALRSAARPSRNRVQLLLVLLYLATYATGLLAVFPWSPSLRGGLVAAHLLAAMWAVPPTIWYLLRAGHWHVDRLRAPSIWLAAAVALLPVLMIGAAPRAVGPLATAGAGNVWTASSLPGVFLDRMAVTPDGRTSVAAGEGLYVSQSGGVIWHRLLPSSILVLGLALPAGPFAVYVGTTDGLYASERIEGPYRRLPFPSIEVHDIAVDPSNPMIVWASSRGGFWRSTDGGQHWSSASAGIRHPERAWAIRYFGDALFASDVVAVYRWDGSQWRQSSDQPYVVTFDIGSDGRSVFASSMGAGIRRFDGQQWVESDQGLIGHGRSGAIHVVSVTALPGTRAYAATMLDGAAASTDQGRDWTQLGSVIRFGTFWRVLSRGDHLIAATDSGILTYKLDRASQPGLGWWVLMVAAALAGGLAGVGLIRRQGERPPEH